MISAFLNPIQIIVLNLVKTNFEHLLNPFLRSQSSRFISSPSPPLLPEKSVHVLPKELKLEAEPLQGFSPLRSRTERASYHKKSAMYVYWYSMRVISIFILKEISMECHQVRFTTNVWQLCLTGLVRVQKSDH